MAPEPAALELQLGYQFRDRGLLERALTHRSRAYEQGLPEVVADNEQLEFLGDSILGFLVSEWLVACFPEHAEGRLSKLKAQLVSASHLYSAGQALHLGQYLLLGRGEELSGGREKKTLLANAIEALIAAIYLDGGMEPARRFVIEQLLAQAAGLTGDEDAVNFKGALKELTQAMHLPPPMYAVVEEHGPEHAKTFVVEVRIGRDWLARASGMSKKGAGQEAAKLVLEKLRMLA
jgi:ribonuclease-3